MADKLTPGRKAQRTKLLQRGLEIKQQLSTLEAELDQVQKDLYAFVEEEISAGTKSVTLTCPAGALAVTQSTTLSLDPAALGRLRAILGERFPTLVEVTEKYGLTSALKRMALDPQPQEAELSDQIRACLKTRVSLAFKFSPAA